MRQVSQLEEVLGSKGRSAQQLEVFEAVFSPMGEDGYPKPLWDKQTGKIDHDVANYWREHDYDLLDYMRRNWPALGPKLAGKLYFAVGDMDHGYLNLSVYLMQDFLKTTANPHYEGTFEYGRPMKGHGWHSMTQAEQMKAMAAYVSAHARKAPIRQRGNIDRRTAAPGFFRARLQPWRTANETREGSLCLLIRLRQ